MASENKLKTKQTINKRYHISDFPPNYSSKLKKLKDER
jgi:hypothetical protein